jgi:protocatechuate 3,4-dioxygenase beta subunit
MNIRSQSYELTSKHMLFNIVLNTTNIIFYTKVYFEDSSHVKCCYLIKNTKNKVRRALGYSGMCWICLQH